MMSKFLKVILIVVSAVVVVICALYMAYLIITRDAHLDKNKLTSVGQNIVICDENGNEIANTSVDSQRPTVKIKDLEKDTVNAFIASEDRTFYSHNGLNYKRMLKALYTNLKSRSFKEGASTISQQLIKNTHLSADKTIKRKLKEIKLTKKLEKCFEKDEILEMYLNTIYFGHNCYGLQSAAKFYFGKSAENLDLSESAVLAGLLTSPNNYSPFKNPEKSLRRRNTVLKAMLDCRFITDEEYGSAINQPVVPSRQESGNGYSDYIGGVYDELEELQFDLYSLSDGCIIKTYLDADLQKKINGLNFDSDNSVIVTTNAGGVSAYKSTIGGAKRQIGSTAKPVIVYAPAIEEKLISPFTRILDEKIDYNGYSPENFDKKFHGYVSVAESIKNSYNVPAVKTLNALTLDKCRKYLSAMNITLEDDEKNLSLALGGMKYGLSLKDLADRYTVFPTGGTYSPSRFIKEITDKNGKTIYTDKHAKSRVFSQGTCSLMNEMLIETSKSGTAKRLRNFAFDVATKTGTCGNAEGNTDAYAVSYTSEHTLAVWLGDKNNERLQISGGGDCCNYVSEILTFLYSDKSPRKLDTESGTTEVSLDAEEYFTNNKAVIADENSPELNVIKFKSLKGNEPKLKTDRFTNPTVPAPKITVKNNEVSIELCHAKYYAFIIKRTKNGHSETIYDGKWQEAITDKPESGCYTYTVTPYFIKNGITYTGSQINLPPVNIEGKSGTPQVKIPDIANGDWFNM